MKHGLVMAQYETMITNPSNNPSDMFDIIFNIFVLWPQTTLLYILSLVSLKGFTSPVALLCFARREVFGL